MLTLVDWIRSGVAVDISNSPRRLIPYSPDWSSAEVVNIDKAHYYESVRALGHLFRDFKLPTKDMLFKPEQEDNLAPFEDNVSRFVLEEIRRFIPTCPGPTEDEPVWLVKLFQHYLNELRYICATHTLSNIAGTRLLEEEVVIGTILAECSQVSSRDSRMHRC
jgi:RNA-dependent RNA polymerase